MLSAKEARTPARGKEAALEAPDARKNEKAKRGEVFI